LILSLAVFSCKRNKNSERNGTGGGVSVSGTSGDYHEQEQEQGQYDDESDFEVKIIDGIFRDSVIIEGYKGNKEIVHIPSRIDSFSVNIIGEKAFSNKKMTSVIIPDSVTFLGRHSFSNNKLKSVTIGNGVTEIGIYAFVNNELKNVIIGKNVSVIKAEAFINNPIESITIPRGVNLNNEVDSMSFPHDFDKFYNDNWKKAGTYLRDGKSWKMKK